MANRVDWYYRQLVSEGDMDGSDDKLEQADRDYCTDHGFHGIASGLLVAEKAIPDLTVAVSGPGVAYDQTGQRIYVAATQSLNVSQDSNAVTTTVVAPGNIKIISVFIKATRTLSNLKKDGNNIDVYYNVDESFEFIVEQSSEGLAPAPPALKSDAKLLADITRSFGVTTITDANIDTDRRQVVFDISAGAFAVKAGTAEEALEGVLSALNEHVLDAAGAHAASAITYAGGPDWADTDPNPATTVELQLDKIISDLASAQGSYKIGASAQNNGGVTWSLAASTVEDQIFDLLGIIRTHAQLAAGAHAATAISNTPAGSIAATTVQAAINELDTEKAGIAAANVFTNNNEFTATLVLSSVLSSGTAFLNEVNIGGPITLAAPSIITGPLTINSDSCDITMVNGAPLQLRTHTGDASEILTNRKTYTACDTFSGITQDDLITISLTNGRTYMITTWFVGCSTTMGNFFGRTSSTIVYATGGAITIAGGIGNTGFDHTVDSSPSISATSWNTSGLSLSYRVTHTGDASSVRCAIVMEVITLKNS